MLLTAHMVHESLGVLGFLSHGALYLYSRKIAGPSVSWSGNDSGRPEKKDAVVGDTCLAVVLLCRNRARGLRMKKRLDWLRCAGGKDRGGQSQSVGYRRLR